MNQKNAGITMLISDEIGLEGKTTKGKEGCDILTSENNRVRIPSHNERKCT